MLKQVILKVPGPVFFGLYFIVILLMFTSISIQNSALLFLIGVLPYFVLFIWSISLLAYMAEGISDNQHVVLVYLLESLAFVVFIFSFFDFGNESIFSPRVMLILGYGIHLVASIMLSLIVKRVLYARTLWFLMIEICLTPIGFITLTPDIAAWEASDKR